MLTQSSLKIVDPRAVCARIICRRQQLQPDRVEFQAPQSKHPLQRHGKNAAAFAIFRGKSAPEKDCHPKKKQKKRPTSNIERSTSNFRKSRLHSMLDVGS
jgi:hypothetical protein